MKVLKIAAEIFINVQLEPIFLSELDRLHAIISEINRLFQFEIINFLMFLREFIMYR